MDGDPLYDFDAPDGVRHTLWKIHRALTAGLVEAFNRIPALYIADGHHRAASAARARAHVSRMTRCATAPPPAARCSRSRFLTTRSRSSPYNRVVKDLGELSPAAFVEALREHFAIDPGSALRRRGGARSPCISRANGDPSAARAAGPRDAIESLDVSVLQDRLLSPILGIPDVRTDKRIDFVGGARGTGRTPAPRRRRPGGGRLLALPGERRRPDGGADANDIMPPKSTWFEPKLRDGLLIHMI